MARKSRFVVDNGTYHVFCRGHNKQKILHDNYDFSKYLNIFAECKEKHNLKLHHYVLMPNHPHLIIKAITGFDLSNAMRTLNQTYAQYYRAKYGGAGYVWQDRFKSFVIQDGLYLLECGRYIELNPVRAGIVISPENYRWSSYRFYAFGEKNDLIDANPEYCGLSDNSVMRMKKYIEFVKDGFKEKRKLLRYFREGVYGDENFIEKLKKNGLEKIKWRKGRPSK
ncbi:MAG: transposase [Elusimicrobia bacterium]|nr:transposase [Elusimicrobiota bacterium]